MAHRLYFAYGSNLDFDQMEFRCPGARYLGVATLPGHRLRMDTAGFATVVPDPAYEVQGALWSLDGADESKMDYYEGVDFGFYEKRYVTVWYDGDLRDGKDEGITHVFGYYDLEERHAVPIDALIYLSLRGPFCGSTFRDYYIARIRNGALSLSLGKQTLEQIDAIQLIAPGDIPAVNRQRMIDYLRAGCKPTVRNLGVEIEHFVVHGDEKGRVSYEPHDNVVGARDILGFMSQYYKPSDWNSKGDLLGLSGETGNVTLEPAAQLEFSVAPYERVADIDASYRQFRHRIDRYLELVGCYIESCGYHPSTKAADLPLIPRSRYKFMDRHFKLLGTRGERMMRACSATQVSIDFRSEEDAVRKFRIASALAPIFGFICDNTPVYEGEPSQGHLARLRLWREVDGVRCATPPGTFDEGFGFDRYVDWILGIPPIYITRPSAEDPRGPRTRGFNSVSTAVACSDAPMSERDVMHALSMCWPDVRLKQFVEIRPADSLPPAQVAGYAALIKGLFYSDECLDALEQKLGVENGIWPLGDESATQAIEAIAAEGAQASVYGMPCGDWVDFVFGLAEGHLPEDELHFLKDLEDFTRR
ncbi:MAG: glutamate-cysteine ligase family protein [Coriobacteriaceae bacterium]|nr:glutamate-cysteine ligase family protein [Coriobacteriaceae bacterium]